MPTIQNQKITTWLLSRPALFAVTSFGLIVIGALLCGLLDITSLVWIGIIISLSFFVAVAFLLRGLPPQNLDRRSFVALNNIQTFVVGMAFLISTLLIAANSQQIILQLILLETTSSPALIVILVVAELFYLYLAGAFIANLYAKYRRVRAMGVSMWRIIATAPFGFAMLWIPGYLLPEPTKKAPALDIKSKLFASLTDWIIARPVRGGAALVILTLLSGFFFGFNAILMTFAMALVFAIWAWSVGPDRLRKNIGGAYAITAIGVNIATWIAIILFAIFATAPTTDVNMTISDTEPALETTM